ncbi:uncharacterized protein LOC133374800 [Rhineura floridana]|uniref:uncharacterized protein LOC133374800 n=1 Tax=Rhineura floridana TaxID=261503 RepID=UPI002AC7FFC4|nr:uncharacterized protein LOC133374800 [Rhineura floridana]
MKAPVGWLWIVALFPLPALQTEEPEYPSKVGQTKRLQEMQDEFVNQTLQHDETYRMWVTHNVTDSSRGVWENITTPAYATVKSSTAYQARRLPKPDITIHSVNGTCNVTLECAITEWGVEDVTYAWSNSEIGVVLSEEPSLRVTQKPLDGSLDYTCTVRNKDSKNTSTVSLRDHCHDPLSADRGALASVYAKYLIPLLIVLVVLVILFLMYRRKRGRGSRSRTVSINESSDSDYLIVEQAAQLNLLSEVFKPTGEGPPEMTQASNDDEALSVQDHRPLSQA